MEKEDNTPNCSKGFWFARGLNTTIQRLQAFGVESGASPTNCPVVEKTARDKSVNECRIHHSTQKVYKFFQSTNRSQEYNEIRTPVPPARSPMLYSGVQ